MSNPILELVTFITRATVRINGVDYEIRSRDEFSIGESRQMVLEGNRLDALLDVPGPSPEETTEMAALLDALCRRILIAPDTVHDKLRDTHRMAIVKTVALRPQGR